VPLEPDKELPIGRPTTLSAVPTPVAAVESKLRMSDLRGAFGGLSETHHQLLVLREFEGLSYDEIGERLDMTRQMVESGLFRARRKLNVEYEELASGRRCAQVQTAIEVGAMASARSLGIRERRRFARHLSHCQACRHVALQAGVDEALVRPRSVAGRIAALLPLPFPLSRLGWLGGRGSGGVAEPATGSALTLGPAAVTTAALAIAGAGGGLLHHVIADGHPTRPVTAAPATTVGTVHRRVPSSAASGTEPARSARRAAGAIEGGRVSATFPRTSTTATGTHRSGRPTGGASPATVVGRAATSSRDSATSGTTGGLPAATGRLAAATGGLPSTPDPINRVASTVGSTAQHVVSTTTRGVTDVGSTVSKVTNTVATTGSKTIQGVVNAGQPASGSSSSPPASSSGQPAGSSPTTAVSGVTKPVKQVVTQTVQAVGQTTGGSLP
jgi:hypothetical protein